MALGVCLAFGAGAWAYRVVGPYGDGPLTVRLYRAEDSDTGRHWLYRDVRQPDGSLKRFFFDEITRTLSEVQITRQIGGEAKTVGVRFEAGQPARLEADGRTFERIDATNMIKIGFSLRGGGVIDAWEYRDEAGRLVQIEIARRRDRFVDRIEYYQGDQLSRVELDEDLDHRVDHWQTFEGGILVKEQWDRDGDGKPDGGA